MEPPGVVYFMHSPVPPVPQGAGPALLLSPEGYGGREVTHQAVSPGDSKVTCSWKDESSASAVTLARVTTDHLQGGQCHRWGLKFSFCSLYSGLNFSSRGWPEQRRRTHRDSGSFVVFLVAYCKVYFGFTLV